MGVKVIKTNNGLVYFNNGQSHLHYPVNSSQLVTFSGLWGVSPEDVFEAVCALEEVKGTAITDFGIDGKFILAEELKYG